MVLAAEIISKPKSRRRLLRSSLRNFRASNNTRRAAHPHSSNSQLLTSNSSLSYDYKRLLCETDAVGGAISQTYASDTTEEFGDLIGEDGQYIHQYDAQANTNALLDETGTVQAQYKYLAFGQVSAVSIDGGPWTAEDWESLPLDFTSNMMAGGKKQYYLDQEIALYLLGSGNNGRYYDAATGRFLSEDPTKEAGGDDNLFRYTGNDPVNNLDPSGHKHHKPYQSPQTQQGQQHNQSPSTLPSAASGALAGKTITPRPAPRTGSPGNWRTIQPTDRPRPTSGEPDGEPGTSPSEPTGTPTTPGSSPGTDIGSGAATGEGGSATVTAGETVGTAVETGGEVAAGTTTTEVGGGIGGLGFVVPAALGVVAGAVGAVVGWGIQKLAVGPIQRAIYAHKRSVANAKGVAAVKKIKETHTANLPKDKPAPTTQPGTGPGKPATTIPGEKGDVPATKADGTETKEPAPPTKEEQPVKKHEEPEKAPEPTKKEPNETPDQKKTMTEQGQTKPPLERIHPDTTYEKGSAKMSLESVRKMSTEEIIKSLKPGAESPLSVKPNGKIVQGNTRIKVLQERGVDVNRLPRTIHRPDNSETGNK